MKSKIICLFTLIFCVLVFTSCSRPVELKPGTYVAETGYAYIILQDDGTFVFDRHITMDYVPGGTYTIEGSELILYAGSTEEYIFEIKNGELIFKKGEAAEAVVEIGTVFRYYAE